WLLRGDFERGWEEYEWRWKVKQVAPSARTFVQPLWDGAPLEHRTILLHAEQGLGDTLQFVRYAALVRERGGRVVLQCSEALHAILRCCPGIDELVGQSAPLPEFDVHAPLLSLPRILGTTLATIPAPVPYLFADGALVEFWKRELAEYSGFRIGIVWQGNPRYVHDRRRSIPLARFGPLARAEGVRLFSLQKGASRAQVPELEGTHAVIDLADRLDETAGAFMDTAAVMK